MGDLTDPRFTSAPDEQWCVCHTRPRCEKKFERLMLAERMVHYLPVVESVRQYQAQVKRFTKPLFPGYVFTRIPAERRARVYQQDLLARVIPVDDEARLLRQLHDVRVIEASGLTMTLHPLLKRGTLVRVIGGPLKGLEGVVDDPANPRGIVLSVDVLQQGLLVKLPMELLKPLPR
jgi:transcription antitermination factor NusG